MWPGIKCDPRSLEIVSIENRRNEIICASGGERGKEYIPLPGESGISIH